MKAKLSGAQIVKRNETGTAKPKAQKSKGKKAKEAKKVKISKRKRQTTQTAHAKKNGDKKAQTQSKAKAQRKAETEVKAKVKVKVKAKAQPNAHARFSHESQNQHRTGPMSHYPHHDIRTTSPHRRSRRRLSGNQGPFAIGMISLMIAGIYLIYDRSLSQNNLPRVAETVQTSEKSVQESPRLSTSAVVATHEILPDGWMAQEFRAVQGFSFQDRIEFWSSYIEKNWEGRKKLFAITPLNQEQNADRTSPLIPQNYDCTTYVETVAALAKSQSPSEFVRNLYAIRYQGGKPSFETRNHFPEADWIPNNLEAKVLVDITRTVAEKSGVQAYVERKRIDRAKWLAQQVQHRNISREIASQVSRQWGTAKNAEVPYIPISQIERVLDQIPTGTVLNLVHRNMDNHPVLISHQGFVVRSGKQVLFRHASSGGRIRTSTLVSYLRYLARFQERHHQWPIIGVNLDQMLAPENPLKVS